MHFNVYKKLAIGDDHFMLLEQDNNNPYLARFYTLSISFESTNFGILNSRNIKGYKTVGGSMNPSWLDIGFEKFVRNRKFMGNELQYSFDKFYDIINTEEYNCYENDEKYLIHVPKYHFRIEGPKERYTFSVQSKSDLDIYFLKATDNDWEFHETLNKGYYRIDNNWLNRILEVWGPFISLLLTESKYA